MSLLVLDRPDLKDPPLVPRTPSGFSDPAQMFQLLRQRDVLVHHPYDSFEPVLDLVATGSRDPNVLAIKQTLYRVGTHAPMVEALADARDANTEVTAYTSSTDCRGSGICTSELATTTRPLRGFTPTRGC